MAIEEVISNQIFRYIPLIDIEYNKEFNFSSDIVFGPNKFDSIRKILHIPKYKPLSMFISKFIYEPANLRYFVVLNDKYFDLMNKQNKPSQS